MIGFGWTNPFPLNMGGGTSTKQVVRNAMAGRMRKWIDIDDPASQAELAGESAILAIIWACNKRLSGQAIPERMIENLEVWEESTGLRPVPEMSDVQRRAELAGKLRGQINNALSDIEESASTILGVNFEELIVVAPADVVSYWPAINPGPPGYEWSSNRAHIAIRMNKQGLTEVQFLDLKDRLHLQLNTLLPAWMTFEIGIDDSFVANVGILGQTLI